MRNILLYVVAFFFLIGAIDYIEGNKFKLGKVFEDGIKTIGPLSLSMIGILSMTPFFSEVLTKTLVPIAQKFSLDASIFPASIIAIDMGGLNLSQRLATCNEMAKFSGIFMSSILGCTISFTLPLAIGLIKTEMFETLFKGILCGIITMPIGLFIGGIMVKVPVNVLTYNLLPIILLAVVLTFGILFRPKLLILIFKFIGKAIMFISIIGLIIQGVNSIAGICILDNVMPIDEVLEIVGRIAIFLGGAYVMLEVLKNTLSKPLNNISKIFNVNINSIAAFIGSLASAIVIYSEYDSLDERGRVICTAFSVGGAYVFGGQMGYIANQAQDMLLEYILVKLICGALAIIFAIIYLKYESKKEIIVSK